MLPLPVVFVILKLNLYYYILICRCACSYDVRVHLVFAELCSYELENFTFEIQTLSSQLLFFVGILKNVGLLLNLGLEHKTFTYTVWTWSTPLTYLLTLTYMWSAVQSWSPDLHLSLMLGSIYLFFQNCANCNLDKFLLHDVLELNASWSIVRRYCADVHVGVIFVVHRVVGHLQL